MQVCLVNLLLALVELPTAVDHQCIAEVLQGILLGRVLQASNPGPQTAHMLVKRTDALALLHNGAVALHDGTNKRCLPPSIVCRACLNKLQLLLTPGW